MITRDFSVISMTSQASLSLSLLLTKVTHAQYRKRFRASYNNHSGAALEKTGKQWRQEKLSFFLRGERGATTRCRFQRIRRNTEVKKKKKKNVGEGG